MYAKIEDGKILFITPTLPQKEVEVTEENNEGENVTRTDVIDDSEGYIELTEEQNEILQKGGEYIDGEFVLPEKTKEEKIQEINAEFDRKINEFLSKYPKREQDTFAEKKIEAEKVLAGGRSAYIEGKAAALGITPIQYAKKIIQKNDEFTALYLEWENQKDAKIAEILTNS